MVFQEKLIAIAELHAQGGTRTRKTLESGDFESPASANSATRAFART